MENVRPSPRRWSRMRYVAAAIAGCALVLAGAGLFILHGPPGAFGATSQPDFTVGGPSVTVTAGGLTSSLRLSPGPYFLGELVAVRMTLTNGSAASFTMAGALTPNDCSQALRVYLDGSDPTYMLPTGGFISCPLFTSTLHAGQTWTINQLLPITVSGNVTLTARAVFENTTTGADGNSYQTGGDGPFGPFGSHWPVLHVAVASTVPADRTISLRLSSQSAPAVVNITAPTAAQTHLYDVYNVTCSDSSQSYTERPSSTWQPVGGTTLREPNCPGYDEVWSYSVGAPGYAIASGKYPANG